MVTYWRVAHPSDYREGRILDLSSSGCFISAERPFAPPARLVLRLVVEEERIDLRGEVVRSLGGEDRFAWSERNGMGVRFLYPGSDAVQRLLDHRRRP